jgi:hypothetical protein
MRTLLLLFFFPLLSIQAQVPGFRWATHLNYQGGNGATPYSVVCDSIGNVYTAGLFSGQFDFDPGPANYSLAATNQDIYIMKQDSAGNFLWAKQIGGPLNDFVNSITIDVLGNLYMIGSFAGVTDFDPSSNTYTLAPLTSTYVNMFILKLDNAANLVWVKQLETSPISEVLGAGIAVDLTGNVFTCGEFIGTADLDPGPGITNLTSTGASSFTNVFVLKLNSVGNSIWVQQLDGTRAVGVQVDAAGNIFTAGYFKGLGDFDPGPGTYTLNTSGNYFEGFITKLNSSGNFVWAKQLSGSAVNYIFNFKIDCQSNVYCSGTFKTSLDADPGPGVVTLTTVSTQSDVYVLKLDAAGNYLMSFSLPKISSLYMHVDKVQNIYLTGGYSPGADFDPSANTLTLQTVSNRNAFVARYNAPGTLAFAYGFTTTSNVPPSGFAITTDPFANVHFVGTLTGTMDLNPFAPVYNLISAVPSKPEPFDLKFSQATSYLVLNAANSTTAAICSGNSVTLTAGGNGTINWYSSLSATNSIGTGTSFVTPPTTGPTTYYVALSGCGQEGPRTPVNVSVLPSPTLTAVSQPSMICSGNSATLSVSGANSYTWNTNVTTNSIVLSPATTGTYVIQGMGTNGCLGSASLAVNPAACLGITTNKNILTSVLVFPNPTKERITISTSNSEKQLVVLYSAIGAVLQSTWVNETTQMDLSSFASGVYFLKVGDTHFIKVIKE